MKNDFLFSALCRAGVLTMLAGGIAIIPSKAEESSFAAAMQQQITVKGLVLDNTGEPVAGASVIETGTVNGAITDGDGRFTISVSPTSTIEISFLGFVTKTVTPSEGDMVIRLAPDTQALEEVVVVGYGVQKKANLSQGLGGMLPGVQVTQSSGQPGQDIGNIIIRGTGTLNTASPMVVIDGIEGSLNDVNPNDVASISVLKDAASSSIYGSKAANGVILVTTKRGGDGKPTVSYSGLVGVTNATDIPEYYSSAEIAERWNAARAYEGVYSEPFFSEEQIRKYRDGSDPDNYPNTDWYDLLYKTSVQTSHNITLQGGTEKAHYLASLGYLYQDGVVKNYDKNQYSGRINVDMKPTDKLETSFSLSYMRQDIGEPMTAYFTDRADISEFGSTNSVYQIFRLAARISPMVVYKYSDGSYGSVSDGNPIAWLESGSHADRHITNLLGIASATYHILPSLSVKGTLAYNEHNLENVQHNKQVRYRNGVQGTTFASDAYSNYNRTTFDLTPEWKQSFGGHNFDALAGFHSELFKYRYAYAYREGMANEVLTDINAGSSSTAKANGYTRELAMISWFGRFSYNYEGKYLFEANARYDGSSRFTGDNRWGFFPSFSAGWRISDEPFFGSLKNTISNMKIRASWGQLGNQDIGSYYPTISTLSLGYGAVFNNNYVSGAKTYNAVNQDLKWEKTTMTGVGVDMTVKDFDITLDYYNKRTTGILMIATTPIAYALSNYYDNIGKIGNRGFELGLTYRHTFGQVAFEAGGNVAYNKSEVLDLGGQDFYNPDLDDIDVRDYVGHRLNTLYGYKTDGLFQSQEEIDKWPEYQMTTSGLGRKPGDVKYVDVNKDGVVNADDRVTLGSLDPSWTFGFHFTAGWKNFDAVVFFQGAADVYRIFNEGLGQVSIESGTSTCKLNKGYWKDSWTPDNTGAKYPRLVESGIDNMLTSDLMQQNASYLRLKELQIGYTLPRKVANFMGISHARIYYSGQNLLTIDGMIPGYDPEGPSGRGNGYPSTMVNSIGLNITF